MFGKPAVKKKDSVKNTLAYLSKIDDEEIKSELEAMTGIEYNLHGEKTDSSDNTLFSTKKTRMTTKESHKNQEKASGDVEKSTVKERIDVEQSIPYLSQSVSITELKNVIKQQANTSEDRYKILEARDRLMRLKQGKIHTLATAKVTIGTCPDMCPEKERLMREFQRQAASYELLDSEEYRINHNLAVKQYSRSSADQEEPMPQDLRPVTSLKMTMSYLLHEVVDLASEDGTNLGEWYHFIWDRMRGIRKDITQQELCCIDSVELVEQCARFHIVCSERLCAEDAAVFDKKINTENLTKCLQTLKYMYHDLRQKGVECENESEFRAYIILLNLNNAKFMWDLQRLPSSIQKSREVNFAIQVYSSIQFRNYAKFFKLVKETTYLNACILLRYFYQVRVEALNVMVKAYCRTTSTTAFPLYELIDILGFEDENEAINFCEQAGLNISNDEMHIILNRQNICAPPSMTLRARNLVESKRISMEYTIGQTIAGGKMPHQSYVNHKPHTSFDSQGFLKPAAINAKDQNREIGEIDEETEQDPYEFIDEDTVDDVQMTELAKFPRQSVEENKKPKVQFDVFHRVYENIFETTKTKSDAFESQKISDENKKSSSKQVKSKMKSDKTSRKSSSNSSSTSIRKKKSHTKTEDSSKYDSNTTNNTTAFTTNFANQVLLESQTNVPRAQSIFSFAQPSIPSAVSTNHQTPQISTSIFSQPIFKTPEPPKVVKKEGPKEKNNAKKENTRKAEEEKMRKVLIENMKKKQTLQKIEEDSAVIANEIETEVIHDICSDILKAEIERIKLFEQMSNKMFHDILADYIRKEVKTILDKELSLQRKLEYIYNRAKNRMVMKYAKIWRLRVSKIKQQRKALGNTPVWLPIQTLQDCAKGFYQKSQHEVVKNMRKRPAPSDFYERHRKFLIPIEVKILEGLRDNFKSLDIETSPILFWKLVISWPSLTDKSLLQRYKHVMSEYLCPGDSSLDPIVKVFKPNPYETLNICIKHAEGIIKEDHYTGMDGLFFIATTDEDSNVVGKRLIKTLLSRQKLMPIPLILIIIGDDKDSEDVEPKAEIKKLLNSGYLSEYVVHHEKKIDENIILKLTQTGIFWLTLNKSPPIPLEMDKLVEVVDACLTEELWLRIGGHSSFNFGLKVALQDPKFVIDMHNETVSHFLDIIVDPENTMYTNFPDEFKTFLPMNVNLPCSYEFIGDDWKKADKREEIERIINSLSLPPWTFNWPITDTVELHKSILRYCQATLQDSHYPTVSCNILSNLFFMADKGEISNFAMIVIEIIKEKLRHIDNKIEVVYNKNHIKLFRTLPWWFKSSTLMNYNKINSSLVLQQVQRDTRENFVVKRQRLDEEKAEVSCIVEKYDSIYENENEVDYSTDKTLIDQSQVDEFLNASIKLEKMLMKQKIASQTLERKLEAALEEANDVE